MSEGKNGVGEGVGFGVCDSCHGELVLLFPWSSLLWPQSPSLTLSPPTRMVGPSLCGCVPWPRLVLRLQLGRGWWRLLTSATSWLTCPSATTPWRQTTWPCWAVATGMPIFWGAESGEDVFQGIGFALAGFHGSFFHCPLWIFSYCWWFFSTGRLWAERCREECGITPPGVLRPRPCSQKLRAGARGLYYAPLATRWRPGSMTGDRLLENANASWVAWGSALGRPGPVLRAGLGQNLQVEEAVFRPHTLHWLDTRATQSQVCHSFPAGHNIRLLT